MFHNLAVPFLHLFILIVKFLYLYVDELNDDDDDDDDVALYQVIRCDVGHMCQNRVNSSSVLVVHVAHIVLVYLFGHLYGRLLLLHYWLGDRRGAHSECKSTTSVGILSQRDSVLATHRAVQPVMTSFFIALMPLIGRQDL